MDAREPDVGSVVYGARWAGMADDGGGEPLFVDPDRARLIDVPGTSLVDRLIDALTEADASLARVIGIRR